MKNYIIFDIDRKCALDKLAIFDAKAALIDERYRCDAGRFYMGIYLPNGLHLACLKI